MRNEFKWNKKGGWTENTWGKTPVAGWPKSGQATLELVTELTASHRTALRMKGKITCKGCEWNSGCPVRTRKELEWLKLTEYGKRGSRLRTEYGLAVLNIEEYPKWGIQELQLASSLKINIFLSQLHQLAVFYKAGHANKNTGWAILVIMYLFVSNAYIFFFYLIYVDQIFNIIILFLGKK